MCGHMNVILASSYLSVCTIVCQSVCPHGTTRLLLDNISLFKLTKNLHVLIMMMMMMMIIMMMLQTRTA